MELTSVQQEAVATVLHSLELLLQADAEDAQLPRQRGTILVLRLSISREFAETVSAVFASKAQQRAAASASASAKAAAEAAAAMALAALNLAVCVLASPAMRAHMPDHVRRLLQLMPVQQLLNSSIFCKWLTLNPMARELAAAHLLDGHEGKAAAARDMSVFFSKVHAHTVSCVNTCAAAAVFVGSYTGMTQSGRRRLEELVQDLVLLVQADSSTADEQWRQAWRLSERMGVSHSPAVSARLLPACHELLVQQSVPAAFAVAAAVAEATCGGPSGGAAESSRSSASATKIMSIAEHLQQPAMGSAPDTLQLPQLLLPEKLAAQYISTMAQLQQVLTNSSGEAADPAGLAGVINGLGQAIQPWLRQPQWQAMGVLEQQVLPNAQLLTGSISSVSQHELGAAVDATLTLMQVLQQMQEVDSSTACSSTATRDLGSTAALQLLTCCALLSAPVAGLQRVALMGAVAGFFRLLQQVSQESGAADLALSAADAESAEFNKHLTSSDGCRGGSSSEPGSAGPPSGDAGSCDAGSITVPMSATPSSDSSKPAAVGTPGPAASSPVAVGSADSAAASTAGHGGGHDSRAGVADSASAGITGGTCDGATEDCSTESTGTSDAPSVAAESSAGSSRDSAAAAAGGSAGSSSDSAAAAAGGSAGSSSNGIAAAAGGSAGSSSDGAAAAAGGSAGSSSDGAAAAAGGSAGSSSSSDSAAAAAGTSAGLLSRSNDKSAGSSSGCTSNAAGGGAVGSSSRNRAAAAAGRSTGSSSSAAGGSTGGSSSDSVAAAASGTAGSSSDSAAAVARGSPGGSSDSDSAGVASGSGLDCEAGVAPAAAGSMAAAAHASTSAAGGNTMAAGGHASSSSSGTATAGVASALGALTGQAQNQADAAGPGETSTAADLPDLQTVSSTNDRGRGTGAVGRAAQTTSGLNPLQVDALITQASLFGGFAALGAEGLTSGSSTAADGSCHGSNAGTVAAAAARDCEHSPTLDNSSSNSSSSGQGGPCKSSPSWGGGAAVGDATEAVGSRSSEDSLGSRQPASVANVVPETGAGSSTAAEPHGSSAAATRRQEARRLQAQRRSLQGTAAVTAAATPDSSSTASTVRIADVEESPASVVATAAADNHDGDAGSADSEHGSDTRDAASDEGGSSAEGATGARSSSGGLLPAQQEHLLQQQVQAAMQQCDASLQACVELLLDHAAADASSCGSSSRIEGSQLVQAIPLIKSAGKEWNAGFFSACRLIQSRSQHPVALSAGFMVQQGINLLKVIEAMRLQAGAMAQGVAVAVAAEETEVRQLLAALPSSRLPPNIQQQLAELGVFYENLEHSGSASAAQDFDLLPPASGAANSVDKLAAHLADSSSGDSLSYLLEHREEWREGLDEASEQTELLSSRSGKGQGANGSQVNSNSTCLDLLLQLDGEVELLAGDSTDVAEAPAPGTSSSPDAKVATALSMADLASGQMSVLGLLKSSRHFELLPGGRISGKDLGVNPHIQLSGPTAETAAAPSALAKIKVSAELRRKFFEQCKLDEVYGQGISNRRQAHRQPVSGSLAAAAAASQAAALAAAHGKLTYQQLVASRPMQRAVAVVTQQLRNFLEQLYRQSSGAQQHSFEVALLIDNSGSMARMQDETKSAMVLLAEVLRHLEVSFALVRFGSGHSQAVLKELHQPFSAQAMQFALESLTFDEGTCPASACTFVANRVFAHAPVLTGADHSIGSSSDASQGAAIMHHRLVLALVDGLTQEMRAEDYITALQPKGIKLSVLNLYDRQQEALMGRINNLWDAAADFHETLNKEHVAEMPRVVAHLITSWLDAELRQAATAPACAPARRDAGAGTSSDSSSSGGGGSATQPKLLQPPVLSPKPFLPDEITKGLSSMGSISYDAASQAGGSTPTAMFRHSLPNGAIPFLAAAQAAEQVSLSAASGAVSGSRNLEQQVDEAQAGLSEFLAAISSSSKHSSALAAVQQHWQAGLAKPSVSACVAQLVQVLESAVLPYNKHTRRRGAESGPNLHIPGVIKAASSNYSYSKIFARRSGGGKRRYQLALLLDVSQSMQGHLGLCGLEALMAMAEALVQVGVEDFSVLAFGSSAVLVKGPDTPWDAATQLALLEQYNCRKEHQLATMDAAAIQAAVAVLTSGSSRAERKTFVISDGYGTSGLALASALQQAEEAGVQVVGLSVGFDRTHVPYCYQHWAAAATPSHLPDALQALFSADEAGAGSSSTAAAAAAGEDWHVLMPVVAGAAGSVREVLEQQRSVFGDLVKQISQHKEAKVIEGRADAMTIDVCMCVDATGSMGGWINACKVQMQAICDSLVPRIEQEQPGVSIHVRWGLVAYRDVGDPDQLQVQELTDNTALLVSRIKALGAMGGGDEPEDIMAALSAAAGLDWQAKARFLALIGDAPAHGRDCNNVADNYPGGSPAAGCDVPTVMQRLRDLKVDVMVMPVRPRAMDMTVETMRRHYDCAEKGRKLTCTPLFESGGVDGMVQRFQEVLNETITRKVVLDHL